ncbi:MAG: amidase [Acidobacteriota bacterium]
MVEERDGLRSGLDRRELMRLGVAAGAVAGASALGAGGLAQAASAAPAGGEAAASAAGPAFETSIDELQKAMAAGSLSARSLAQAYLARIEVLDPKLHAVIELNPDALAIADGLDRERREKGARGPLHGIPVLLKDNLGTGDRMQTTAGSLALAGASAPRDAGCVERLRQAGAVVLGKTNLSEWANFRSTRSTSGWSGRGGLTRNPYALDRNPSGSSSGSAVAVAANLCTVAVGTETDGSIVSPSSMCGIVGLKPTVGLVSRAGIVPIAHSQDTAGPMATSVRDAALLLGALVGEDPRDPATAMSRGHVAPDYTRFLDPDGLRGARIGVARNLFGLGEAVDKLMAEALDVMRRLGAEIIDPAEIPNLDKYGKSEFEVLLYEFKADLESYLAERYGAAPAPKTLPELIAWNEANRDREMPFFGQEIFEMAAKKGPLTDKAYRDALETDHRYSRREGIDAVLAQHKLDALVAPTGGPAWTTDLANGDHASGGASSPPAVAGYPSLTVPIGFAWGLPVGMLFLATAWNEGKLLRYGYAYEQASKQRRGPRYLASAEFGI